MKKDGLQVEEYLPEADVVPSVDIPEEPTVCEELEMISNHFPYSVYKLSSGYFHLCFCLVYLFVLLIIYVNILILFCLGTLQLEEAMGVYWSWLSYEHCVSPSPSSSPLSPIILILIITSPIIIITTTIFIISTVDIKKIYGPWKFRV